MGQIHTTHHHAGSLNFIMEYINRRAFELSLWPHVEIWVASKV
jgi:hypothetical protein